MGTVAAFRAIASVLRSRAGLAHAAGITFGGARNIYEALGYKVDLQPSDYRARYRRNAVAARVVEAYPRGTWRGIGELIENEDPKTFTPFERAWADLAERLSAWPTFLRTDILAGLGRYAVLLFGAPGDLETPMPDRVDAKDLIYLQPFSEEDAQIETFVTDQRNERFGQAEFYSIKRIALTPTRVHWSRAIHTADGLLDDHVFGQPRQERVWNLLDDLEKITGAGAESFWLRAHQGFQFDLDKEMELDPAAEAELKEQVDAFVHGMQRAVRTRGVEMKAHGSDVANFDRNVDAILSQISAGTGIPQRILTGSERGQLASTQDRVNWAERVYDRRQEFAGPLLVRPFVDRCIKHGILPTPTKYDIRWPQIYDLSDDERAIIAGRWGDINQKMKSVVVTPNEIRDRILGMAPLSAEEIKAALEQAIPDSSKVNQNQETNVVDGKRVKPGAKAPAQDPSQATGP